MNTAAVANKLSDKEKDELIKQLLGKDYNSVGNNLPVLKKVIDVIGHVDAALSVAELLPLINTVLVNSRILSIVASGASVFSIFMFPVSSMISIIDAYQVGHRIYSYRAIAYTLSAWAFNKPVPVASQ